MPFKADRSIINHVHVKQYKNWIIQNQQEINTLDDNKTLYSGLCLYEMM